MSSNPSHVAIKSPETDRPSTQPYLECNFRLVNNYIPPSRHPPPHPVLFHIFRERMNNLMAWWLLVSSQYWICSNWIWVDCDVDAPLWMIPGSPFELPWLRLGIYSTALLWRKKYFTYEEQTMCVWLSDCTINCNFFEHVQRIKTEGVGIIHGLCREQRGHRLLFIIEITKKLFVNYLDESCRTSPDDRWCVTSHKDSTHYLIAPKGFISNFVTACSPWLIRPPFESIPTWTGMLACLGADEYYPSVYISYIQIDLSINLTGLWAATWFVLQNKHRNLMT